MKFEPIKIQTSQGISIEKEIIEIFEYNNRNLCIAGSSDFGYKLIDVATGLMICMDINRKTVKLAGIELLNKNPNYDYSKHEIINQ